ncbi:hypothetical protein, partial [Lacticaseibacillus rhamnosus]|uniref:hypothetical protein n=1 Tax=Lacticaseibacillus rhamnosus TaxID=47715 RepID=UPI0022EBE4A5
MKFRRKDLSLQHPDHWRHFSFQPCCTATTGNTSNKLHGSPFANEISPQGDVPSTSGSLAAF